MRNTTRRKTSRSIRVPAEPSDELLWQMAYAAYHGYNNDSDCATLEGATYWFGGATVQAQIAKMRKVFEVLRDGGLPSLSNRPT